MTTLVTYTMRFDHVSGLGDAIPCRTAASTDVDLDRQKMVDHVTATIGVVL